MITRWRHWMRLGSSRAALIAEMQSLRTAIDTALAQNNALRKHAAAADRAAARAYEPHNLPSCARGARRNPGLAVDRKNPAADAGGAPAYRTMDSAT